MLAIKDKLIKPFQIIGNFIPTRTRITLGLVAIVVGAVVLAMGIGVFPNQRKALMRSRASFTETLAMSATTLATSDNRQGMQALLDAVVQRRDQIVSIGIRNTEGELVSKSGPHEESWDPAKVEHKDGRVISTETQMSLPIYMRSEKWADLEIQFVPMDLKFGLHSWQLFLLLTIPFCFFQFDFFLRHILKQLDPSGAVPTHVRDVLDNLGVGLMLLDPQDRILLANPVLLADIDRTQKELLGKNADVLNWISENGDLLPWTETMQSGVALSNRLLEIDVHQRQCMFSVNSTPIVAADGQKQGTMVTFKDITTLEENKREIAEAKVAAEAASHAKGQFLANMSHEIRTPMNAIVGFTDILRRGLEEDPQKQLDYLDTIHSSGKHLVHLINDVLDLSKIESMGVELEIRDCSPFQIVGDVVNVLKGKADDQGIQLSSNANSLIPQTIKSDPTRLRQVLLNLVGNAVKFTKQGGVRVDFGVVEGPQGPQMRFDVIDTGIGMSKAQADKIFDPFVQADSSVTRRFGGTGLGLSISKKISEAMGGGVSVVSQPGEGSVFTVLINVGSLTDVPMLSSEQAEEALRSQQRDVAQQGIARVKAGRILIVDDTVANTKLLDVVCSKAGLTTDTAENGKIAVDKVSAGSYDVILMDMQMPVMDGYTATKTLRSQNVQTPVVALTGNANEEDRQKCYDSGCSHFLPKPVDIDELIAMLQDIHGVGDQESTDNRPAGIAGIRTTSQAASETASEADRSPIHSNLPSDMPEFQVVISQFVDTIDTVVAKIDEMYEARDFSALAREAHSLKGAGGTVGFPQFTMPAKQLEDAATSQSEAEMVASINEIRDIASRVTAPSVHSEDTEFEASLQL